MSVEVSLTVNGHARDGSVEPRTHLADYLREQHHLTGTHLGCEHGGCGACTLLVDGNPVRSCITFAVQCEGSVVQTIENMDDDPTMTALRDAFSVEHALQCGYCTPGFVVATRAFLDQNPNATLEEIRDGLGGNICRCGTYDGITKCALELGGGA